MGPDSAFLEGRNLGMDFQLKDGFRMYHGRDVPGFPSHPHRGFETVTLVRQGYCDHADSLGAAARFGAGDAQWITAGGGIVHSEMFPLLSDDEKNPLELFQIWLNLPSTDKMVPAHFSILWSQDIPRIERKDAQGRQARISLIAGELDGRRPPPPPPHSWAARQENDVAIWTIELEPGAELTLPPARATSHRALYFYDGDTMKIGQELVERDHVYLVRPDAEVPITGGAQRGKVLVLQGKPIGQPVAQHGPFVMNTHAEIAQAVDDYRKTGFGEWPWPHEAPVHGKERGRFARYVDGSTQEFPRTSQ